MTLIKKTQKKSNIYNIYTKNHTKRKVNRSIRSTTLNRVNNMKLYKNRLGTKVLIMPNRKDTETASLYFYFKVGSKNETPDIYGISHFIEHMLFKGSPKFPNYLDISKTFDSNGISFNAYTSKDITAYHYKFLSTKENVELICNITSDMLYNSFMRQKDITPERNVIIQEYNDGLDDIDNVVNDTVEEYIFKGHPLAHTIIGSLDTLHKINKTEIVDYYKKHYIPSNLLISFSGKYEDKYISIINKYFKSMKSMTSMKSMKSPCNVNTILNNNLTYDSHTHKTSTSKKITHNNFIPIPMNLNKPNLSHIIPFVDNNPYYSINCISKQLTQDYVNILFKTRGFFDPNRYYYKLLYTMLGGNMSSRLFVEIREKLGLAYTISCDITNYEEVGYFNIYTQNEPADTLKCLEHIFKELLKFKKNGTTKTELENNKKNYCDIYKTSFDDIEDENEFYSNQILFNKPFETIDMRIKAIQSITEEQIKLSANDLFDFTKVHIITFGKIKKDKIEKVLKKFI